MCVILIVLEEFSYKYTFSLYTGSQPCVNTALSRNLCPPNSSPAMISVPVYVGGVKVDVNIGLWPSVSVCVRVFAAQC